MMNGPYIFQRMMVRIFLDLAFVHTYLDDVVDLSRNITEHEDNLHQVLEGISAHKLKVKYRSVTYVKRKWNY